jgi:hypothetical protein
MSTPLRTAHTTALSHCTSAPTSLRAPTAWPRTRASRRRVAKGTCALPAPARQRARSTEPSSAQHTPWPRMGVMGCHASPAKATLPPLDARGASSARATGPRAASSPRRSRACRPSRRGGPTAIHG